MKLFICIFSVFIHFSVLSQDVDSPRNIILMIGDGMGLTQITAAKYSQTIPLHMERFPVVGLITTHASCERITDSAAAGTSLAAGIKTFNGGLGVDTDSLPVESIIETIHKKGFSTGLIVTCDITHATPAAFYAHQPNRNWYESIAVDFLNSGMDLIIGGGRDHFDKRTIDDRNLVKELIHNGYHIKDINDTPLNSLDISNIDKLAYFTSGKHPVSYLNGRKYLPEATALGLKFLDNNSSDKGFFLMIEGAQIDWAGHDNDTDYLLAETLDFDRAVGEALQFAEKDGSTLVIVLSDHETGGMGLNNADMDGTIHAGYTTGDHTATMVPVFAFGPGAALFSGMYDNTDVYFKMRKLLIGDQ